MVQVPGSALHDKGLHTVKKLFFFLFAAMPLVAMAQTPAPITLPAGVVKPAFFDKQGIRVLGYQKGASGLNIWQVEKGATKTVFYSTPDNKTLMSGVLWEADSGKNVSDAYITSDMIASVAPQTPVGTGTPGKPSEAIAGLSALTGIKEGKASIDKTLYIVIDPRCPYCHNVYNKTRAFVKAGGTIKWLPSTVLGDNASGARLVAEVLEAKDPVRSLASVIGKKTGGIQPSAQTMKVIAENEAYFYAAFQRNKSAGQPGVPVAFFETKDGSPQMVSNLDDDELLKRIFTDIKK